MNSFHSSLSAVALGLGLACTAHAADDASTDRLADRLALEAIAAAAAPDPYRDSMSSVVIAPLSQSRDRAEVEREAVMAAHSPVQNLAPGAFFNSIIPTQYHTEPFVTRYASGAALSLGVQ